MGLSFLSSSSSSSSLISLLIVFLFLSSSLASPSTKAAASSSLLNDVCHQAKNSAFCLKALGSDPSSRTANLNVLGQISIELAIYNASSTSIKIHSLLLGARNPRLKACYLKCAYYYQGAGNDLQDAKDLLQSGYYRDVNVAAVGADTNADLCEGSFKSQALRSTLSNDNLNLELLCDIIATISNLLEL